MGREEGKDLEKQILREQAGRSAAGKKAGSTCAILQGLHLEVGLQSR